jgi:hypothetical protein
MQTATITRPSSTSIFDSENPGFQKSFDEKPFEFDHCFHQDHPLFQLGRMRHLVEEGTETRPWAVYDAGEIQIGQKWETYPKKTKTVEETFDDIDSGRAWMMLRHVEKDPAYGKLLDQCLEEVTRLSGREIDGDKKSQEAIIFLTSPNRVTAYHIDRECNFLMQVRGRKTINVFDRSDRDVVPEEELEKFWAKDNNAGIYKPQFQDRAYVFGMKPGTGVHIPVNSPHWLKNDDNVSISFSISYQYKDWTRKNVYQANYHLRKMGLHPTPPGKSALIDNSKRLAVETGLKLKKLVKRKSS